MEIWLPAYILFCTKRHFILGVVNNIHLLGACGSGNRTGYRRIIGGGSELLKLSLQTSRAACVVVQFPMAHEVQSIMNETALDFDRLTQARFILEELSSRQQFYNVIL